MPSDADIKAQSNAWITSIAWVIICVSGLFTLMSVMQHIMLFVIMPAAGIPTLIGDDTLQDSQGPDFIKVVIRNFELIMHAALGFWAATLIAAIGFLRRSNLARQALLVLTYVAIFFLVIAVALTISFFVYFPAEVMMPGVDSMYYFIAYVVIFYGLLIAGLVLLLTVLSSASVKQEFGVIKSPPAE